MELLRSVLALCLLLAVLLGQSSIAQSKGVKPITVSVLCYALMCWCWAGLARWGSQLQVVVMPPGCPSGFRALFAANQYSRAGRLAGFGSEEEEVGVHRGDQQVRCSVLGVWSKVASPLLVVRLGGAVAAAGWLVWCAVQWDVGKQVQSVAHQQRELCSQMRFWSMLPAAVCR